MRERDHFQNFAARILSIFSISFLLILLIADATMFIIKGEIDPLFKDLTIIMLGFFGGMITTIIAFYFGDPRIDVSMETLQRILTESETHEQGSPNDNQHVTPESSSTHDEKHP